MHSVMVGHRADRVAFGLTLAPDVFQRHRCLSFKPHLHARIFRVSLREFAQQILRVFIDDSGQNHFDFDVLISASVASQTRGAFLAQPEDLSGLRARRNAQLGFAAYRRHFDLRAQRRLGQSDGNDAINVVALAGEYPVRGDVSDYVKVARSDVLRSGFAFVADDDAGAGVDAGGYAHLDGFVFRQNAATVTTRAGWAAFSGSAASGAALVEAQKSFARGDLPSSIAGRTGKR